MVQSSRRIDTEKEAKKIQDDVRQVFLMRSIKIYLKSQLIMNPNYELKPERLKVDPSDETQIVSLFILFDTCFWDLNGFIIHHRGPLILKILLKKPNLV